MPAPRRRWLSALGRCGGPHPRPGAGLPLLSQRSVGGMGQRVMIAMMLVGGPDILIADEPTSALDVTVQMQVLAILDDLVSERGLGLIFISHDLNLVASFCDRVLIMYAGQVVETCAAAELHRAPSVYPGCCSQPCRRSTAGHTSSGIAPRSRVAPRADPGHP